jgi:hypothetical protein
MKLSLQTIYKKIKSIWQKNNTSKYAEKTHKQTYGEIRQEYDQKERPAQAEMHKQNGTEIPTQPNNELIKREKLDKTPFEIINKGEGWFIGMSPFIITPTFKTKGEAIIFLERNKWNIIINLVTSLIHYDNEVRSGNIPLINTK